jgi:hypothetical protein
LEFVTETPTVPLPAGLVAVIEVDDLIETPVAEVLPNFTVVPAMKPVPVTVTEVPPAAAPLFGLIEVIVGAVAQADTAPARLAIATKQNKMATRQVRLLILRPLFD